MQRPTLLIGSVPPLLPSIEEPHKLVLQYFAKKATEFDQRSQQGPLALEGIPFYQDPHWSDETLTMLSRLPGVQVIRQGSYPTKERYSAAPILHLKKGASVSPSQLDWGIARRTRQAIGAYKDVVSSYNLQPAAPGRELVPLQVGINIVDMLVLAFRTGARHVLNAAIQQLYWELADVWDVTNGNAVFLIESPVVHILANATHMKAHTILEWYASAFKAVLQALPEDASWGFHFCYGRVGGRAMLDNELTRLFQLPKLIYNYRWTVELSNFLFDRLRGAGFTPSFIHYPLIRGNDRPRFSKQSFTAFEHLRTPPSARLYFGGVHPQMSLMELVQIYQELDLLTRKPHGGVGMSSTCGWGSSSNEDMARSLQLMRSLGQR